MNDNIILYTIGCPRCEVLQEKLDNVKVKYSIVTDMDVMEEKGISAVPVLQINDKYLSFVEALQWVRTKEEEMQ